jgi:hypothetical protein
VSSADDLCSTLAAAPTASCRVRGRRFLAWLSDDSTSPAKRFMHATAPYERVDGQRIANDWSGLISAGDDGGLLSSISRDERAGAVSGDVWTATAPDGTLATSFINPSTSTSCNNWTDPDSGGGGFVGSTTDVSRYWTTYGPEACRTVVAHLYCFEE